MKKVHFFKIFVFLIFILFNFQKAFSQIDIKMLKNWELKGYAKSAERYNDVYSAIDYYAEYYKRKPNNNFVAKKLALLYLKANNYEKASELFIKNYNSFPKKNINQLFYYAQTLKNFEQYDSAVVYFDIFLNNYKKTNKKLMFYLANQEIGGCKIAKLNVLDSIQIIHLENNINSPHLDTSPMIIDDSTFYYVSFNENYIPYTDIKDSLEKCYTKFFMVNKINNQWVKNDIIETPFINIDTANVGNGVFSHDKMRFYFTISKKNWKFKTISAIYVSEKISDIWTKPHKLTNFINLYNYSSTQPTIGNCYDKYLDIIYFVSDRKGGFGGKDIWYTVYDKRIKKYKKPVNASTYINTPKDEITPFYEINTKTLYFSSNGLSTLGGFDIFKISGELVNWTLPENLGKPLNSSFDDFYYNHNTEKDFGFLVSNRNGTLELKSKNCCYDIFEFSKQPINDIIYNGIVYESEDNIYNNIQNSFEEDSIIEKNVIKNYIDSMIVVLELKNENTGKNIYLTQDTTDVNGEFNFEIEKNKDYVICLKSDDYINSELEVVTNEYNDYVTQFIGLVKNPPNSIIVNNIYFEFNETNLTKESKELIDTSLYLIMKQFPQIIVEISAHTDYIGTEEYNLELSQKRANSVVNYLISKDIEKERMKPVGYGELIPIAPAIRPDGTDIPEGREKNRRIEFKIIGLK